MDYSLCTRKELQALCKEHGIPSRKSTAYMVNALRALLNTPAESKQNVDSIPNPREVSPSLASEDDAFEFQPNFESLQEIMTPGNHRAEATTVCLHRIGREPEKQCRLCILEKNISMQDVLQVTPSRRPLREGESQNGTIRIQLSPLCHGLRRHLWNG